MTNEPITQHWISKVKVRKSDKKIICEACGRDDGLGAKDQRVTKLSELLARFPPGSDDALSQEQNTQTKLLRRSRLFTRLGIREKREITVAYTDVDGLIDALCDGNLEKRLEAAHILTDIFPTLKEQEKARACIILVLMVWRDDEAGARIAAIGALAEIKMHDAADAIQIALLDENKDVRAAAARALGEIGDSASTAELEAASKDKHWSVRASAIQAMGKIGDRAFLNTITRALDDDDASVRIEALHALSELEGVKVLPRILMIARRERHSEVKYAAALIVDKLVSDL